MPMTRLLPQHPLESSQPATHSNVVVGPPMTKSPSEAAPALTKQPQADTNKVFNSSTDDPSQPLLSHLFRVDNIRWRYVRSRRRERGAFHALMEKTLRVGQPPTLETASGVRTDFASAAATIGMFLGAVPL